MIRTLGAIAATGAAAAAILTATPAQADTGDYMYRIGADIPPGDYTYRVVGSDWGSWELCATAGCEGDDLLNIDVIDGVGHTGYVTVPSTAKYLKVSYLNLQPA
jgi:hypothetical protein